MPSPIPSTVPLHRRIVATLLAAATLGMAARVPAVTRLHDPIGDARRPLHPNAAVAANLLEDDLAQGAVVMGAVVTATVVTATGLSTTTRQDDGRSGVPRDPGWHTRARGDNQ